MQPAKLRREQELRQLVLQGVPLRALGKSGHWIVGPLHIYTGAGRWFNEQTQRRGRLNDKPMHRIIEAECYSVCPGLERPLARYAAPAPTTEASLQLLIAQANLALNCLESARIAIGPKYRDRALGIAQKAYETVRQFLETVNLAAHHRSRIESTLLALSHQMRETLDGF